MDNEKKYRLTISDISFSFPEENDVVTFADSLFSNCDEGVKLYDNLISQNAYTVFQSCIDNSLSEESQLYMLETLRILQRIYGRYFDPEGKIFMVKNRLSLN